MQIKTLDDILAELDNKQRSKQSDKNNAAHAAKTLPATETAQSITDPANRTTDFATFAAVPKNPNWKAERRNDKAMASTKTQIKINDNTAVPHLSYHEQLAQQQARRAKKEQKLLARDAEKQAKRSERALFDATLARNLNKNTQISSHLFTAQALADNAATDRRAARLRWLLFYYLSKREMTRYELLQKVQQKTYAGAPFLPNEIDSVLDEFAQKDYQSDDRFIQMVLRHAMQTGRGKVYIKEKLRRAKADLNGRTLIDIITDFNDAFDADYASGANGTDDANTNIATTADWLALAIKARVKKYGNTLPQTPKEKARQLRFLQYRGFEIAICLAALKQLDEEDGDSEASLSI